jgi:hypothetical protein
VPICHFPVKSKPIKRDVGYNIQVVQVKVTRSDKTKEMKAEEQLSEKVKRSFESIKLDKALVNVPSIEAKQPKIKKQSKPAQAQVSSQTSLSIHQILSLMFGKKDEEEKPRIKTEEGPLISETRERTEAPLGGYGTASKSYGASPESSYSDYSKLFSYLGKFKAFSSAYSQSSGEDFSHTPEKAFQLADIVTIETGARFVKYFSRGSDMNTIMLSVVPIAGMDSAEWAQFKLWAQLDPVMYRLKTTTS